VSFAHHTSKNPDLLLEAWELLVARGGGVPTLTLLGMSGARRARFQERVEELGLHEFVRLEPFLPEEAFRKVMSNADLVVFPSDFEGFGLPVLEGMVLGKPVVIGPEPAVMEVSGGHAQVASDWTPAALADAVSRARAMTSEELAAAREWALSFSWERTVRGTRSILADLAGLPADAGRGPAG
jgi:glycosyltransferase involved in cell wall biosynthesis